MEGRERMEERGGRLFLEEGEKEGKRAMNVMEEADSMPAFPQRLPTFHG